METPDQTQPNTTPDPRADASKLTGADLESVNQLAQQRRLAGQKADEKWEDFKEEQQLDQEKADSQSARESELGDS